MYSYNTTVVGLLKGFLVNHMKGKSRHLNSKLDINSYIASYMAIAISAEVITVHFVNIVQPYRECWLFYTTYCIFYFPFVGTSDAVLSCAPPSPVRTQRQVDVPPVAVPAASSMTPLGRKGRLANLAATIGSWEEDLSHPTISKENAQGKHGTACGPSSAYRGTTIAPAAATKPPAADSKPTISSNQVSL